MKYLLTQIFITIIGINLFGQAGTLDPTFGSGGIVKTSGLNVSTNIDYKKHIVSGNYVYAGRTNFNTSGSNQSDIVIQKYNLDGTPVASFGSNGRKIVNHGDVEWFGDFTVLPSEEIVVSGTQDDYTVQLFKLNTSGNLVSSFGTNGKTVVTLSDPINIGDIAVFTDGSFLVSATSAFTYQIRLIKFKANGTLDTSFGTNGILNLTDEDDGTTRLFIDSQNKIYIGTASEKIIKLNANGSYDTSFGTGGKSNTSFSIHDFKLTSDNKIIACGYLFPNFSTGYIGRFNANGSKDGSFGNNGIVTISNILPFGITNSTDNIFITGQQGSDCFLAKLSNAGVLDSDFGTNGIATLNSATGSEHCESVSVMPDNNILISGKSDNNILLAKYRNSAPAPTVHIPDPNFKAYLVGNTAINTNGDGEIQVSEAEAFMGEINCQGRNVSDLTGIEAFVKITTLKCGYNHQLTNIDVSKNIALSHLVCENAKLSTLSLEKNIALIDLSCFGNLISELNLSNNANLSNLSCFSNQLTTLDISKNISLKNLECQNNQLIALDLSKNTILEGLKCGSNQLTVLDVSKNIALNNLICDNNQLTHLEVGTSANLKYVECYNNQLTTLDVSNTALTTLKCDNNQLTDLRMNTALRYLECNSNQLTALDVSKNTALTGLLCKDNQLASLNVKNGNNTIITSLQIQNNPSLTCVTVDDTTYSNANWLNKDPQTKYSLDCDAISSTSEVNVSDMVHLYPNPVSDKIQLDINQGYAFHQLDMAMYDILGNQVLVKKNIADGHSIDVGTLSSGIYVVKIYDDEKRTRQVSKVVKE